MSNFLAIATVSAAIQRLLEPVVHAAVLGANVWIDRPDVARPTPGTNIYLHCASVSPALRHQELPSRPDGTPASSRIAVDLHYLLTFHGDEDQLEPQRLLGAVIAALHARPLIAASLLTEVLTAAAEPQLRHSYLAASDLADTDELVGLEPDPLILEDLAKLWSLFPSVPYVLSSTYVARTVTLDPGDEP
ncbi:MAG: DUF4255 domain-containing protein [Ornithinibacter sp.]